MTDFSNPEATLTYAYALRTTEGFLGVLCSDPACEHILHECREPQPDELTAERAASDEFHNAVGLTAEQEAAIIAEGWDEAHALAALEMLRATELLPLWEEDGGAA